MSNASQDTQLKLDTQLKVGVQKRDVFAEVLAQTNKVKDAAIAIGISPLAAYQLARVCGWEPPNTSKSLAFNAVLGLGMGGTIERNDLGTA